MIGKTFGFVCLLTLAIAPAAHAQAAVACTDVYAPVCGLSGVGLRMTYSNACWARASGATVLHAAQCQGPICSDIYKPVCARPVGTRALKTYPNLCTAEAANAVFVYNGRCHK